MTDRTVLITGCSTGIGECVAHGLAGRGYRVLATARREEDVQRLQAAGLESFQLDVAEPASVEAGVEQTLQRTERSFHLALKMKPGANPHDNLAVTMSTPRSRRPKQDIQEVTLEFRTGRSL